MAEEIINTDDVQGKVIVVRGQQVLLDKDVAALYGVETRIVKQAVKNNPEKFPEGYLFILTDREKKEVIKNFDNPNAIRFSPVNPTAFTERGLYMLATILKSKKCCENNHRHHRHVHTGSGDGTDYGKTAKRT